MPASKWWLAEFHCYRLYSNIASNCKVTAIYSLWLSRSLLFVRFRIIAKYHFKRNFLSFIGLFIDILNKGVHFIRVTLKTVLLWSPDSRGTAIGTISWDMDRWLNHLKRKSSRILPVTVFKRVISTKVSTFSKKSLSSIFRQIKRPNGVSV